MSRSTVRSPPRRNALPWPAVSWAALRWIVLPWAALTSSIALPVAVARGGTSAPPAPASAPAGQQPVHRFLRVAISPDGRFAASVEGDSPTGGYYPRIRQLMIRRLSDGAASEVTLPCGRAPECWPDSPAWAPDGRHLVFALRTPGTHARGLYQAAATGGAAVKLLDFSGTLDHLKFGPDGRLAVLATANAAKETGATEAGVPVAGDLDAAPAEQRIALIEGDSLRFVSPPDLYVYEYDWRPAGRGFVGTASPGDGDANWWTAKLYGFEETGADPRVLYSPAGIRQQLAAPAVSRDGRNVAFIAGIMSDFGSTGGDVYSLPLDGGPAIDLTPDMHASASALTWACDGHLTAKLLSGDRTEFVDLGGGARVDKPRTLWSGSDAVNENTDAEPLACPSNITAVAHESFTTPPEIEAGPIGRWRNVTTANAGLGFAARVQSLWWQSDEFRVQGWLMLPPHADGKLPLVTIVHGGPAAASVPSYTGPGLVATLLEHGYAIFRPNPRGSYGQGETFTLANVRDFGHGDLRDILSGIDAAIQAAPIDATRLGITGGSYGGFMTMFAVTQTDRFKAAVAAAGVSDWLSYYGENGIDAWMLPYFGASAYEDPAIYARSSAIDFIRNVHTPTFEYVGERDIECPAAQTQEFWHALKSLGVPTSIMIYPGEGHGLRDPAHSDDALRRSVQWFDRYLAAGAKPP